jgi:hypothetical protein
MKKTGFNFKTFIALLTICFAALSIPSFAQKENTTVTGELLDMDCYMASGAHGDGHKSCADMCIKGGGPMGVLTGDGKVYLLLADDSKKDAYDETKKHAGEQVTVTGVLAEKDGIKGLVVNDVKTKS